MDDFLLGEFLDLLKRGILWFIVTVIFTSRELREEAYRHLYFSVIRIPGVFYGLDVVKGFQSIKQYFPERHKAIQTDYILGYVKSFLLTACVGGVIWILLTGLF